jgi:hypothetical protein
VAGAGQVRSQDPGPDLRYAVEDGRLDADVALARTTAIVVAVQANIPSASGASVGKR